MKNWQIEGIRWSTYLLEISILFIAMFPYFLLALEEIPYGMFILPVLFGAVYGTFLYRFTRLLNPRFLMFLGVLLFSILIGWQFIYAAIIAIVIQWRCNTLMKNYYPGLEFAKSLSVIIIGLLMYAIFSDTHNMQMLIPFIIFHFIFTSFIRISNLIFQSNAREKQKVWEIIKMGLFHLIFTIGVLNAKYLYPYLEYALRIIGKGIAYSFGMIAPPIFSFFQWLLSLPVEEPEDTDLEVEAGGLDEEVIVAPSIDPTLLLIFIGLGALVVIAYLLRVYLKRKRKGFMPENIMESIEIKATPSTTNLFNKPFRSRNTIRRLLFRLEKSLVKSGNGRHANQTVEDWIMGLSAEKDSYKRIVIEQYQKVRYGELALSHVDFSYYKQAIESLKKMNR